VTRKKIMTVGSRRGNVLQCPIAGDVGGYTGVTIL